MSLNSDGERLIRFYSGITLLIIIFPIIIEYGYHKVNGGLPEIIKIGGIFERGDEELELAFRNAIERVNSDRTLLPRVKLTPYIERIKPNDSFHAAKLVCNLIEEGTWALFGSHSPSIGWLLRSLSSNLHIPHFSIFWDYRSSYNSYTNLYDTNPSNFSVNLHPEASALSKAFMDLVLLRNWKSFTIIVEENDELIKMKDLLRITSFSENSKVKMTVLQRDPNNPFKKILKDLRRKESNIVLSIAKEKIVDILREAKDIGMMTEYNNYLIATLDIHTLNLSEFQYIQTNITGLSMLDPQGQEMGLMSRDWIWRKPQSTTLQRISTMMALINDAVTLFAKSLGDFEKIYNVNYIPPLTCESKIPWTYGTQLMNSIRMANVRGYTGIIKFDQYGQRSDFELKVLEMKRTGMMSVATWTKTGISMMRNFTENMDDILEAMKNKEFIVSVPTDAFPYISYKPNYKQYEGNDQFTGYCVDLLNEIKHMIETDERFMSRFQYKLKPVADGKYGSIENGHWNGMLGELINKQADLAIADLTATYERETGVDFTMPFMNLGIAILFRKPVSAPTELFAFLKPFSTEVWLYVASAYLGVSLLLSLMSRITPYEWVSEHPCELNPSELENQFSIGNSLWFTIGSLMQQGSDLSPRAPSTRTLATIWWFFTLIIVSSYTANLAASLTASRMSSPIESAEDLAKQNAIQYGCKIDGATRRFFQSSNNTIQQRLWNVMENTDGVLTKSSREGINRVKKGGYAFFMESSSIEYETQRDCDLIQIGNWLDNKGYGIATPPDSPYRTPISNAIIALQDKGKLIDLKNRWWIPQGGTKCRVEPKVASPELGIENVGGVFVVLGIGIGVACAFAALEFIWKTLKTSRHQRKSMIKMVWSEIVRIITCGSSHRPAPDDDNKRSSVDSDSIGSMSYDTKPIAKRSVSKEK